MERKIDQIIILNIPQREQEGQYLKKLIESSVSKFGIEVNISMDCGKGLWDNYSKALKSESKGGTHKIIVHDDISFDRNIIEKILHVFKFAPDDCIVGLYNPTNGDYLKCSEEGRHILMTQSNFWLQAAIYPYDLASDFVDVSNAMTDDPNRVDDSRLKAYLQYKGLWFYAVVPGLAQHLGAYRSSFGTSGKVGKFKRYSSTYDNQLDVLSIDWAKEFENPFIAKMTKDWVKEIVNKEFIEEYGKY